MNSRSRPTPVINYRHFAFMQHTNEWSRTLTVIALGANAGPTRSADFRALLRAIHRIRCSLGRGAKLSPVWSSPAFPPGSGPPYVNAVLILPDAAPPGTDPAAPPRHRGGGGADAGAPMGRTVAGPGPRRDRRARQARHGDAAALARARPRPPGARDAGPADPSASAPPGPRLRPVPPRGAGARVAPSGDGAARGGTWPRRCRSRRGWGCGAWGGGPGGGPGGGLVKPRRRA